MAAAQRSRILQAIAGPSVDQPNSGRCNPLVAPPSVAAHAGDVDMESAGNGLAGHLRQQEKRHEAEHGQRTRAPRQGDPEFMPPSAQGGRLHECRQQREGASHFRVLRRHQHAGRQPESRHGGVPQRGALAHGEGAGQRRQQAQRPHGEQVEPKHQRPNHSRCLNGRPNILKVGQHHAGGGLHQGDNGGEQGQPRCGGPRKAPQQQAKANRKGEGGDKIGHLQKEQKQQNRGNNDGIRAPSPVARRGDAQQKQHRQGGPAPTVVKADVRGHAGAVARIPRDADQAEDRR